MQNLTAPKAIPSCQTTLIQNEKRPTDVIFKKTKTSYNAKNPKRESFLSCKSADPLNSKGGKIKL